MIKASILCSFFVVMINMLSGGGSVFGDVKAVETLSPRLHFNMDDSWKFYKGDASEAMNPDFDDVAWDDVNLPHDWSIEGPFDKDLEHRGGYLPSGIGWYRKTITLSPDWRGRRIFIEFEGVFRNSVVFVNGKEVGKNIFGYTGANYDITDFVRFEEKNNIIAVKIDNPDTGDYRANSEGWWYEGCGIYRHVWLTATNPLHVDHNGMFITTPQVSKAQASVRLSSTIRNDTKEKCLCTVKHSLYKADGSFIGSETVENVAVPPQFTKDIASLFVIDSPKLWSPDAPYLYTAATQVISQEKVLDAHQTTFGVRWFEFTPDKGFFLNGKHLQLRGMCVHHDFGGLGVALPDRANYKTVEEAKKMGCNLIRSAHNDAAPALMEACDRLGMLVWAETRYMDNAWNWVTDAVLLEQCPEALRYLIRRDRNHPAIICWGLANTAGSADGVRTKHLQVFNDIARAEDPTRPTAVALERNTNANANGFAMVTDIVGYNGGGMGIDDADHRNYPDRKMLISEFSSGRCARGIYERVKLSEGVEETLGDGRVIRLDGKYLSNYDGCIRHEKEWRHVAQRPWLAGGIIWSGIEYWGESAGWPVVTSQFGVMDLCRFPKDPYYFYLQEWTEEPMVHILPHWTWPGKEGRTINVWCYSNGDSVELFLNGKSLGVQPRTPLSHIEWKVPYEAGELTAVGVRNSKEVCRDIQKTAGKPFEISLEADRTKIRADGKDLSFVTVRIMDANGVMVPTADDVVTFKVTGNGRLLGVCNGDPASHANPRADEINAFNGMALAIVQSSGGEGVISLLAESNTLRSAKVDIISENHGGS